MKKIASLITILTLFLGITTAWGGTWLVDTRGNLINPSSTFSKGDIVGIMAHILDQEVSAVSGAQVFLEIRDASSNQITSLQGLSNADGYAVLKWKISRKQNPGTYTANLVHVVKSGYSFAPAISKTIVTFTIQ